MSKTVEVEIEGTSPLLMHSTVTLDPTNELAQKMKELSAKRKKTLDDHKKMQWAEWKACLYWDADVGAYIPAVNLDACIRDGAKRFRKGSTVQRTAVVDPEKIPLIYSPKATTVAKLWEMHEHTDYRSVKIGRIRVMRCRPRFNQWSLKFIVSFDSTELEASEVQSALEQAGQFVGLGDYRPRFGRFNVTKFRS